MRKYRFILCGIICILVCNTSCLSPHDPSAYSDEDNFIHDSEKTDAFVTKKHHDDSVQKEVLASAVPKYEAKVFTVEPPNSGFGYKIFVDGSPKLSQNTIPAIPGNKAFSTPEKAMRAAEFVIHKMQSGEFPPTVNKMELDSLGVLD